MFHLWWQSPNYCLSFTYIGLYSFDFVIHSTHIMRHAFLLLFFFCPTRNLTIKMVRKRANICFLLRYGVNMLTFAPENNITCRSRSAEIVSEICIFFLSFSPIDDECCESGKTHIKLSVWNFSVALFLLLRLLLLSAGLFAQWHTKRSASVTKNNTMHVCIRNEYDIKYISITPGTTVQLLLVFFLSRIGSGCVCTS